MAIKCSPHRTKQPKNARKSVTVASYKRRPPKRINKRCR